MLTPIKIIMSIQEDNTEQHEIDKFIKEVTPLLTQYSFGSEIISFVMINSAKTVERKCSGNQKPVVYIDSKTGKRTDGCL